MLFVMSPMVRPPVSTKMGHGKGYDARFVEKGNGHGSY